ncbi:MAG: alpha/beta hydrolase [Erysipelothrix sp.]|nr:alpha/beta hydrolase [Erysipelothrix sp.]
MKYVSKIDGHITHMSYKEVAGAKYNVLIVHGMAEHRFRYEKFMDSLALHNINSYALDLRGHGESKVDNMFGYFGKSDGYKHQIADIHGIVEMIKSKSDLPLIIYGHSMGSLFSRAYTKHFPNRIDKLILSGSPYLPDNFKLAKKGVQLVANITPKKPAQIIANFINKTLNKDITNPRTDLDWLSFDSQNVDNYISDPMCNFPFTYSGYLDLFNLLSEVYLQSWDQVDSDMPILFQIGAYDPCPNFENNGYNRALLLLKSIGYRNIHSIVYDKSRHELLNDLEKDTVTHDILDFILN